MQDMTLYELEQQLKRLREQQGVEDSTPVRLHTPRQMIDGRWEYRDTVHVLEVRQRMSGGNMGKRVVELMG